VNAGTEVAEILDLIDISADMRDSLESLLDNLGSGEEESVTVGQLVGAEFSGGQDQAQLIHGFVDAVIAQKIDEEPIAS
jgi:hypothetical protein